MSFFFMASKKWTARVDIAVVGHGGGGLADALEMGGQLVYVAGAIEKRVVGMEMKVGELCCHSSS